jgi:RecA-family ATPase
MGELTDYRLRILQNGFTPLPCKGKRPVIQDWQNVTVTPDMVRNWETLFPNARNTGVRCAAIDVDVNHPVAADLSAATRDWFDGKGNVLTRFGKAPRFLVPIRGNITERKIFIFRDAAGNRHQIEIRTANSQFICDGSHPETHQPYTWHAGRSLDTIKFEDLPQTDDKELEQLVDYLREILAGNSLDIDDSPEPGLINTRDPSKKFDPFDCLRTMHPSSAGVAKAQPSAIMSLLRKQFHPEEIQDIIVAETIRIAAAANLGWTRAAEEKPVAARLRWAVNTLCHEHEPEKHGDLPTWLCADFHEAWLRVHGQGERPQLFRNPSGWCVRGETGRPGPRTDGNNAAKPTSKQSSQQSTAGGGAVAAANDASAKPKPDAPSGKSVLKLRPFKAFDASALPPRSWLYGKHYQRRTVSLTAGPGGMGKSSLDLVEAIAMATCRNLLGEQPEERLRVWYHNGEDPLIEIDRRIAAICQHYKIPQTELEGYLFVTSGNEFPLRVAKGYSDLKIDHVLVQQISTAIAENKIDLAVFDPLVTLHSVSEVDSGKMDSVIRLFAGIGDDNDAGIEIAHHVRKPAAGNNGDYDVHDIRGVAAITDAVRAARVLNRMSEKDAEAAGCNDTERLFRFRVDRAKANYSPPQVATWRQFVNIELPNGDEVGVVAGWNFPGQGLPSEAKAQAERRAEDVYLNLLGRLTLSGVRVTLGPSANSAPAVFARQPEAKNAKVSKRALADAQDRLLAAERICLEAGPGYGRTKYVRAV